MLKRQHLLPGENCEEGRESDMRVEAFHTLTFIATALGHFFAAIRVATGRAAAERR